MDDDDFKKCGTINHGQFPIGSHHLLEIYRLQVLFAPIVKVFKYSIKTCAKYPSASDRATFFNIVPHRARLFAIDKEKRTRHS